MSTTISPFLHQSHNNNNNKNHLRSSPPQSPPQITDIRHVHHRPNHTTMPLLLTNLTFRRISVSQLNFRFNQIRINPVNNTSFIPMAEQQSKKNEAEQSTNLSEQVKDKESEKSKTVIVPTPPEKPLPGDCCGNGCIPCVWDTYYEELEEYNRLCKEAS